MQDGDPSHRTDNASDTINSEYGTRTIVYQYENSYPYAKTTDLISVKNSTTDSFARMKIETRTSI